MRALVTGGAGFIGSHLVDRLLEENWDVVVLDNLEPRVHQDGKALQLNPGAHFIRGDVRDKNAWQRALTGADVVLHHAAYQDYMPDYSKFFHTNAVGTALLYEVVREQNLPIQKIIVASSQAVYGEGQYDCAEHGLVLPPSRSHEQMECGEWDLRCPQCGAPLIPRLLDEAHPNPYNQYALSKYSQEMCALRLGRQLNIPTVALRYSITQGPRQSPYNSYSGICRIFTLRLLNNQPPLIYEDGQQLRDYVHISDVVDANLCVLRSDEASFEAFNVGSGTGTTVLQYVDALAGVLNRDVSLRLNGKFRVGDNRHSVSSVAKLRQLGWAPRKTLLDIITDYVDWIRDFPVARELFLQADQEMERVGVVCDTKGELARAHKA